jgi:hypothetical protein
VKLRRILHGETQAPIGWAHYCPGCKHQHTFHVETAPHWKFNGDQARPTFTPSMRVYIPAFEHEGKTRPERTICHYHLVKGRIRFLNDSRHELKGKTLELPDLPGESPAPGSARMPWDRAA